MDEISISLQSPLPINLKLSVCFEFVTRKDLPDIVAIATKGKLLLKRSSSHSPVLQQFCLMSGLPMATVVLLPASSKVNLLNDDTYRLDSASRNYVILRTNRAKCTLNKEILDLLNEENAFLKRAVVALVYFKLDEKARSGSASL